MSACCAELVSRCFDARTVAHFAHLRTRSYAQHVALKEFYEALLDATDAFAECCMGVEGMLSGYPAIKPDPTVDIVDYLTDLHAWVTEHRSECADGSTELANLIDEILAVIDRTFYKLKFLK
jgi:hypothetical protein